MRFRAIFLFAFLTTALSGLGQSLPAWAIDPNKKWPSDPTLAKITRELDVIRRSYPWDESRIRTLYAKHVVPHKDAYLRAKVGREKLDKIAYFWSVALEASFRELDLNRKLGFPSDPIHMLHTVPFEMSAEFVRVAYCLYVDNGQAWIKDTGFAHRLLKLYPNDPLVMEGLVAQVQRVGSKEEALQALDFSVQLLKQYPEQEQRYLPRLPQVCGRVLNLTNDVKYYKMALAYYDQMIASKKPYFVRYRKHYQDLRARTVAFGKKLGYEQG